MAKYIVTSEAQADIDEILAYISTDNFDAAIRFYDRLLDLFSMLGENPKSGRERGDITEGLRSFPESNYLIFYRVWAGNVAIARVIHGSRDIDEMFSE